MYSLQCWRTVHRPTYILSTDLPYPILRLSASTSRQNCALKSHFPSAANHQQLSLNLPTDVIIIIVIYSLNMRVVGALRNQFPPLSSFLHCPLGLGEFQACPFADVVSPPLLLSALSSSPFHCALQDGFGQT